MTSSDDLLVAVAEMPVSARSGRMKTGPGAAAGARTSGGFGNSFRTAGGASIQTDAAGKVASPTQAVRQGFAKSAKPYAGRSGIGSRGGFAGSKGFGGAAS